jgi:hypothetical protein
MPSRKLLRVVEQLVDPLVAQLLGEPIDTRRHLRHVVGNRLLMLAAELGFRAAHRTCDAAEAASGAILLRFERGLRAFANAADERRVALSAVVACVLGVGRSTCRAAAARGVGSRSRAVRLCHRYFLRSGHRLINQWRS